MSHFSCDRRSHGQRPAASSTRQCHEAANAISAAAKLRRFIATLVCTCPYRAGQGRWGRTFSLGLCDHRFGRTRPCMHGMTDPIDIIEDDSYYAKAPTDGPRQSPNKPRTLTDASRAAPKAGGRHQISGPAGMAAASRWGCDFFCRPPDGPTKSRPCLRAASTGAQRGKAPDDCIQ